MSTTVTGLATPSLEARLASRAGLRPDVRRLPLFGLGCAAGAAGVGHLHELLAGRPGHAALLLSTELCSLTLQATDSSMANLVAGALFGDGAAALVAVGRDHPLYATGTGPEIIATQSRLYPGTEHLLGWDIGHWGMRMVLGRELPDLARLHVAEEVESFLAAHDLKPADVDAWICHPGGPKILDALSDALALPESAFAASRRSLAAVGNLSSASVLHILEGVRHAGPRPGSVGLMLGFGPGFASNSSSCAGELGEPHELPDLRHLRHLLEPVPAAHLPRRRRTARRAGHRPPQHLLEPGPRRPRVRPRPLPGHGRPAHRAAARLRGRTLGGRTAVRPPARLVGPRRRPRRPGPALVVHRRPRPALEHPGARRSRAAPGGAGPLPGAAAPQLRGGGRGRGRAAAGPLRLADRPRLHRAQPGTAARADRLRGRRPDGRRRLQAPASVPSAGAPS